MNYSGIRKRKLASSKDNTTRDHQLLSEELASKLECYTPVISGKGKKTAHSVGLKKTENGTFLMQLSEDHSHELKKGSNLAKGNGFKKLAERP